MLRSRFSQLSFLLLAAVTTVAIAAPPPGKGGGGGKSNASLTVTVTPESFTERDAGAVGIVTRENSTGAVTVTITSSDTSETTVAVPGSVEIPAGEITVQMLEGQDSVDFDVIAVDDNVKDGDQQVTISVSATDHSGASTSITVVDDEGLPNVVYESVTISVPSATTVRLNDFNDLAQACGRSGDPSYGWIYCPGSPVWGNRPLDAAVDVNTLDIEGLNAGWVIRNCVGISNNGLVVGVVSPVDDPSEPAWRGYVLDISVSPAQFYELPDDGYGWESTYARKVNDNGDILGTFTQTGGVRGIYFFNAVDLADPEADLEIPDLPIITGAVMNNPPEGVPATIGATLTTTTGAAVGEILFFTRGDTAAYYPPPEITTNPAVNDFGGIAGRGSTVEQINKKKFVATQVVYRDYVTEEYLEGYYGIVKNLNNAGTIMIRASQSITLYHDDYGFIDVASITSQGEFPEWTSQAWMNNYGTGGFGQIAVLVSSDVGEFQILTPVDLTP